MEKRSGRTPHRFRAAASGFRCAHVCGNGARESRPTALTRAKLSQLHLTHILIRIKRLCELCAGHFGARGQVRERGERRRERERGKREEERQIKEKKKKKKKRKTRANKYFLSLGFLRARCRFYRSGRLISHDRCLSLSLAR